MKVRTVYENAKDLDYEVNSLPRRISNFLILPILNLLPGHFNRHLRRSHKSVEEVVQNATNHKALDTLYTKGSKFKSPSVLDKFIHRFWFGTNNSKAVRNRLKLVIKLVEEKLRESFTPKNILSIASGSTRAIITALSSTNPPNGSIKLFVLDKNPEALRHSQQLCDEVVKNRYLTEFICDTASKFPEYIDDQKLDIVEMVGLIDYFEDEKVIQIFNQIYQHLKVQGIMISANILDNPERNFVTNVVGWKMVYRTPEDLIRLAERAGFEAKKIKVHVEPLKVHAVITAKK